MKFLFVPISILSGILAGLLGRKLFDRVWGIFDEEEPPDSRHLEISWQKLLVAAALQGAIFRAIKEATDHGSRRAFMRLTGTWPGEERPEPE
jgi:Protein of unknown function (DUF4235)